VEAKNLEVAERVSASRALGRREAVELAAAATRVIVAKGRSVRDFRVHGAPDDELIEAMLGATGNLRAPLLRVGDTLLVGFNAEAFEEVFT